ncbi:methanethiol S-methyltransferase [Sandarakinorhabdus sp.]|uniref:methanethiol S-methyltransferase n=1 Tax=Sandarakinorhabdus sp. TaxID=1916663 RepID=UPI00286DD4E1|nr:methanethiol S-methyltransferase [Sandarakinorhabdus sp.]
MRRFAILLFSVVAHGIFFATFLYLIAFTGDISLVPRTVDRGPEAGLLPALLTNLALIGLFGLQHSAMARPSFKRVWTRVVPPAMERSVYVLLASLSLVMLFAFWSPIQGSVWDATGTPLAPVLWTVFATGWGIVLLSTFLINHFELFGLHQAWLNLREKVARPPELRQPLFYRWVAHPLYSGFFLAFWATPHMSFGHLLLALGMSAYMFIAIPLEERDLTALFGPAYQKYRSGVGMLIPRFRRPD